MSNRNRPQTPRLRKPLRHVRTATVAAIASSAMLSPSAKADAVLDTTCITSTQVCQLGLDDGSKIYMWRGPWVSSNDRCDLTAKIVGGTTSSAMIRFYDEWAGQGGSYSNWSNFLYLNQSTTFTWYAPAMLVFTWAWKAQANRSLAVRLRITGPCEFGIRP